jgi:cystathionine beta-lyase
MPCGVGRDSFQQIMSLDDVDPERLARRLSAKWQRFGAGVLPAWVAEMDYPIAPAIRGVIERALEYDDFGYPASGDERAVPAAFAERMLQRFGWTADPARVEVLSDVVQGLYIGLLAFTAPADGVLIQTPIYPPFLKSVADTGRRTVTSALVDTGTQLGIDFDHLRSVSDGVRVLLLCHPHNPTGRVFTRAELEGLAALAIERDWLVFSDEIHADLTHAGGTFVPFAALGPEVAARTITLTSATKAFNIAGLRCAVAHFGARALQTRFNRALPEHVRGGIGILGQHCTVAAWRAGDGWLEEVKASLDRQRHALICQLRETLPEAKMYLPDATYLGWLDLRELALEPDPADFFRRQARVALFDGRFFGDGFEQHARLNFATSPALLGEMVERMVRAVRARRT